MNVRSRRADFLVFDNSTGRKRVGDLMVVHPAPDQPGRAEEATECCASAKRAEERKYKDYTSDYNIDKRDVLPLAFETLDGLAPSGTAFCKEVADIVRPCKRADGHLVDYDALRSMYIRDLRERVAVSLQEANAHVVQQWIHLCCREPFTIPARAAAARRDLDRFTQEQGSNSPGCADSLTLATAFLRASTTVASTRSANGGFSQSAETAGGSNPEHAFGAPGPQAGARASA